MKLRGGITFAGSAKMVQSILHILEKAYGEPVPFDRMWLQKDNFAIMDCGVCWLYCWATTGSRTHDAAAIVAAKDLFNKLFPFSYLDFEKFVDEQPDKYKWAQETREKQTADFEGELMAFLASRKSPQKKGA